VVPIGEAVFHGSSRPGLHLVEEVQKRAPLPLGQTALFGFLALPEPHEVLDQLIGRPVASGCQLGLDIAPGLF
jgi:hypothetical protein